MGWIVILFASVKQRADIIGTKQYVTLFNKDFLQFFNFRQMKASLQKIKLQLLLMYLESLKNLMKLPLKPQHSEVESLAVVRNLVSSKTFNTKLKLKFDLK